MSSAKILTDDIKLSTRSLMLIRKNNGPNIDSRGTPVLTGNQSEVWTFSKTYWNLLFKNLFITLNKSPMIPPDFNL